MILLKKTARSILPEKLYTILSRIKHAVIFFTKSYRYYSVPGFFAGLKRKQLLSGDIFAPQKKIIWAGCFSPNAPNIGDHAQTLAVEIFLKKHFPDYRVLKFYRHEIGSPLWNRAVRSANREDLILMHSMGNFGSRYHKLTDKNILEENLLKEDIFMGKYSWHDVRKKIILSFLSNPVIQLPTTVYYEPDEKGRKTLSQDKEFYKDKNVLVLCREPQSMNVVSKELPCRYEFFPDFAFYLKPPILKKKRKGALLALRTDAESQFNDIQRAAIHEEVKKVFSDVLYKNVQASEVSLNETTIENYLKHIFGIYQSKEIVVTDMMHGMIFAVINKTPCVALDDAIPHKVSGYKDFLGKSVKFAGKIEDIPRLIKEVLSEPYRETDLSAYFEEFREKTLKDFLLRQ